MNNQNIEERVAALEAFRKSLTSNKDIPRDLEQAFRARLVDIAKDFFIFGTGTFVGGKLDVSDVRIKSTSIGLAIRLNSSAGMSLARADLASGFLSGNTWRFFEGTFSETYEIAYFIIPV